MADETGDIETDLPPLPPKDYISRLGFPAFALVERPVTKFEQKAREMVVVYMTSGKKYQFELESLDVTIEWLRDQVLEQRMVQ
uniref:Target of rapamycin complex 2 subunit MAPKAP1-like Ras-binding domain-containing protein n=1 Tax=Plectus sambesii TaxID=2011161 RepID=A0A914VFD0_9BILA